MSPRLFILLAVTLLAFAGNSILTRAALVDPANTPLGFTAVRLLSGAIMLFALVAPSGGAWRPRLRDVPAIAALSVYALGFSLAYLSIGAASGALILFGVVQMTMLAVALVRGVRLGAAALAGAVLALAGLAWLLAPGLEAPPLGSALLMAVAGAAWGAYSLLGQGAVDPVARTARNFVGAVPVAVGLLLAAPPVLTPVGWGLALTSGAVTSGLGYALWYRILPRLSHALAANAQLSVPVLAALIGAATLGEAIGLRMATASALILGGVWLSARR